MLKIGGAAWTRNLGNSIGKHFRGWKSNSTEIPGLEVSIQENHFYRSNIGFMCPSE